MKHILYFVIGAIIVFICTYGAYELPSLINIAGSAELPGMIRWFLGLVWIAVTIVVGIGCYRIGQEVVEKLN